MSSFKNAAQAQRRTHRERSQPAHRKKFGLLEKHKDYIVRAKDFNKKKTIIKKLKNIADEKNPDEYYHGMIKSKLINGKHTSASDNTLSLDALKLLKTQDANYLSIKLQAEKQKVEKLRSLLHNTNQEKVNCHTFFVDSDSDVDNFHTESHENEVKSAHHTAETHKILCKLKKQQYSLLQLRMQRVDSLNEAAKTLNLQRVVAASKGSVKKSVNEDTGVATYKWRKQRAR